MSSRRMACEFMEVTGRVWESLRRMLSDRVCVCVCVCVCVSVHMCVC